jgi:hypothetical protein
MTAVEWLLNEIDMQYPHINIRWKQFMIEQAFEMEKQQIMDAFQYKFFHPYVENEPEQYYDETYKKIKHHL